MAKSFLFIRQPEFFCENCTILIDTPFQLCYLLFCNHFLRLEFLAEKIGKPFGLFVIIPLCSHQQDNEV